MDRNTFYDSLRYYQEHDINSLQHHGIKGQKWGIRRYQNPDGTLTEEGKQRYLNPDGTLTRQARKELKPDQQLRIRQEFAKKQSDEGTGEYADNAIYDEAKQKEKLDHAKQNKMYDLTFVETIQNAENLTDDDVNREYEAYLKNPRKYMQEFHVNSAGEITNSRSGVTNANKPKTEPKKETSENSKPDTVIKADQVNKWLDELGDKKKNMSESDIWKYIGKKSEEEMNKRGIDIKGMTESQKQNSSKTESKQKLSKEEKKEAKAAQKQVEKNLKGGIIGNWALLNQAMKEAGITDTKNMTASDWNKVNEEIKKLRK